ncbi:MAG: hypothetical protein ACFFDT_01220 [Candidatus Hodarchaeota archaeon]
MSFSTTKIKLYGPGISHALKELYRIDENTEFKSKIHHSGVYIGEVADYEIAWSEKPTDEETLALVKYLDEVFLKLKSRYTVTSSNPEMEDILEQIESSTTEDIAITFIRLIGPSISTALAILNENIGTLPGIKSVTGVLIGRYDYAFEWLRIPDENDIVSLTETIDPILKESGVIYTITTKSKLGQFKDLKVEPRFQRPDSISFISRRIL